MADAGMIGGDKVGWGRDVAGLVSNKTEKLAQVLLCSRLLLLLKKKTSGGYICISIFLHLVAFSLSSSS